MKKLVKKFGKESIEPVLAEVKANLHDLYGEQLRGLILFGSYARGEATEDSDIDLLVVLCTDPVDTFDEIHKMGDMVTDVVLDHQHLLGVVPASEKEWETSNWPLFRNIRKEGIWL